ncbi:probable glutathione S-transferase [Ziziphus jujuba]|uniref:glutathione transferase n=1 Tax=Ziziphus jujuba TaxID=326968 RepID=A0A6P4A2U9_ZIZJJ|nr:probable glutathione S-transferase [Ziziphus jujuba]
MAREEGEVKLIGFWVSPFVRRVEWALKLKGIDYEYIEEDVFNKSPLLLKLNPVVKKVPVLVHHQKPIAESFFILEYIDETWKHGPSLLPQDPYERARARFWAKFAEEKVLEAAHNAMCSLGEDKEKAVKLATEALEKIEEELNKGKKEKFFGGEDIGYMDIAIGWISYWLPVWEEVGSMPILDPPKFPAITEWTNNFVNHPLIKHNLPPRDKMVDYFHERAKNLTSFPN